MSLFKQRGNTAVECVQWTGFNTDEVKNFVLSKVANHLKDEYVLEFIRTELLGLIIVINLSVNKQILAGGQIIARDTWLVDQEGDESDLGFVLASRSRFEHLYEPEITDQAEQ